jgi:hypothetical protein
MEPKKRISNSSDILWKLFGNSLDLDAVKVVENSWGNCSFRTEEISLRKEGT